MGGGQVRGACVEGEGATGRHEDRQSALGGEKKAWGRDKPSPNLFFRDKHGSMLAGEQVRTHKTSGPESSKPLAWHPLCFLVLLWNWVLGSCVGKTGLRHFLHLQHPQKH